MLREERAKADDLIRKMRSSADVPGGVSLLRESDPDPLLVFVSQYPCTSNTAKLVVSEMDRTVLVDRVPCRHFMLRGISTLVMGAPRFCVSHKRVIAD